MAGHDLNTLDWLLSGDVSIRYQTRRDLMADDNPTLRDRIAAEGWGKRILACRKADGGWGESYYQPKWTSTHYTLLDLKGLQIPPDTADLNEFVEDLAARHVADDGGFGHQPDCKKSDVCVTGMFLNFGCYFGLSEAAARSFIDFLLPLQMEDGGFNCRSNRSGARHCSFHSTLSVLEGFLEYRRAGHRYRLAEVLAAEARAREVLLQHRLFRSDRTGRVIHPDFLKLPHPARWRYNVLRALDHFQEAEIAFDPRMEDALDAIDSRRRADGRWPRMAALPGKVHVVMEPPRGPGRWATLLALRVLAAYRPASAGKSMHLGQLKSA